MFEGIKNACIFLILAQILMILVPEEAYAKYLRVLISIILILKITEPVINFVADDKERETIAQNLEQMQMELYAPGTDQEMITRKQQLYEKVMSYVEQEVTENGAGEPEGEDTGADADAQRRAGVGGDDDGDCGCGRGCDGGGEYGCGGLFRAGSPEPAGLTGQRRGAPGGDDCL